MNCYINSNCRDEQVGGIDRIPQSYYYCFISIYICELFDIHDIDHMLDDIDLMKFDNYVGKSIIDIDWENGEICKQWSKFHC